MRQRLALALILTVTLSNFATAAATSSAASKGRKTASTPAKTSTTANIRPGASMQSGDVGLGAVFGEPTGLTLKLWRSHRHAFDIALSYSFFDFFEIAGDYLWHFPAAVSQLTDGKVSDEFVPYIGIGGLLLFDTSDNPSRATGLRSQRRSAVAFGLRIPAGLEFLPHGTPLGIFAELTPGLGLAPTTFGFLEGGVGARYYF